ncbi:MAG: hypothetical protein ACP5T6_03790, partial [Candidatus Micrarchaeia archaeon]
LFRDIEDVYIKNKLLGFEKRNVNEYLDSFYFKFFNNINTLKNGKRFSSLENLIFDIFSKINYVSYPEFNDYLMDKIPRYAQYMASKIIK